MDPVKRVLQAGEHSEIARIARSGLVGWRAMLAEAVQRCPEDPGLASAVDLIRQLDELLGTRDPAESQRTTRQVPVPDEDHGLKDLVAGFICDPAIAQSLDEQSLAGLGPAGSADAIWRTLHLCILRLPEQSATRWRAEAASLAATGDTTSQAWRTLSGENDAILVPVRAAAAPAAGPSPAGYRTSPHAPVDEEVLDALGLRSRAAAERDGDAAELCRLGSLLLSLTALDDNLVLALESTLYQGSRRLDDELRQRYRTDLLGRLREYARSVPDSMARLEALLDVDEAVNSLTHRPPAPGNSWWAQVRQQSRRMVDRSVGTLRSGGADVEAMPLSLRYRDVRDLTSGNDVASRSGGEPGDVLACLRLWARVGGKTLPGRVIYRA